MTSPLSTSARIVCACLCSVFAACSLPNDPEGTLGRVRGGVLRVGISENPPWTETGGTPKGIEPALVRELASQLNAEVQWVEGADARLFERLERGELDLVVAGIRSDNPWGQRLAFTKSYTTVHGDHGKERHVWAIPSGENAWLLTLDKFLAERDAWVQRQLREWRQ